MNKKTRKIIYILVGIYMYMFTGCEYEKIKPLETPVLDNVSFSADIIPIFNNSCSCHSSQSPKLTASIAYKQLWTDGENAPYVDTANPASSKIYVELTGGHKDDATQSDYAKILKWIELGAKNN